MRLILANKMLLQANNRDDGKFLNEKLKTSSPHNVSKACKKHYYTTTTLWHSSYNSSTLKTMITQRQFERHLQKYFRVQLSFAPGSAVASAIPTGKLWTCLWKEVFLFLLHPISYVTIQPEITKCRFYYLIYHDTTGWQKLSYFRRMQNGHNFSFFAIVATNASFLRKIGNLQSLSKSW